ncbi:MAG: Nramp family divalent metal transporter [Planctomycetota bacterium]
MIGPGIVMMGIQIGGGEWLFGPEITARFGGGLMWLATIAIILQVFYNMEVGRYALYCGEPIFTGFLRTRPGPLFWVPFFIVLCLGAIIPGLAFHAASVIASLLLDRPPTDGDRGFVLLIGYVCLIAVFLPVLFGGKVYNTLQTIMSAKVIGVLGFCLIAALLLVSPSHWWDVFSGFLRFGSVPSPEAATGEPLVNVFSFWWVEGRLPEIGLAEIAVIGAFVGFAGGGGLGNSMYSNYVRDKGWGMGSQVGAIPSAIGGKNISLSHLGKIFPMNQDNLAKWKGWWNVVVVDQLFIWAPGCFVGMALPALLSLQFAQYSPMFEPLQQPVPAVAQAEDQTEVVEPIRAEQEKQDRFGWANAVITADGIRHAPQLSSTVSRVMWTATLLVGLLVLLPSQLSVVDDVSRRWTDVIWSASSRVRDSMHDEQVKYIYYALCGSYFVWCLVSLYLFGIYGTPRLMTLVIANLGNLALGLTSLHILYINCRMLPPTIRPNWVQRFGLVGCSLFYLGLAALVFVQKQMPIIRELLGLQQA